MDCCICLEICVSRLLYGFLVLLYQNIYVISYIIDFRNFKGPIIDHSNSQNFSMCNSESLDFWFHPQAIRPKHTKNSTAVVPGFIITTELSYKVRFPFNQLWQFILHLEILVSVASMTLLEVGPSPLKILATWQTVKPICHQEVHEYDISLCSDAVSPTTLVKGTWRC